MTSRHHRILLVATAVIVGLTACSSGSDLTSSASTSSAPASAPAASAPATSAPAASSAAASASPASSVQITQAPAAGPISGPCDLLTVDQIQSATGVAVSGGTAKVDQARQVQMCTWQSTDPFLIVAASLTDVAAEDAFNTNVDLAPAYFDGNAVDVTVPGADKAYAVQQPDVGWVVGAIAKGRFVQVQAGSSTVTQDQVVALVQDAIQRMPG